MYDVNTQMRRQSAEWRFEKRYREKEDLTKFMSINLLNVHSWALSMFWEVF